MESLASEVSNRRVRLGLVFTLSVRNRFQPLIPGRMTLAKMCPRERDHETENLRRPARLDLVSHGARSAREKTEYVDRRGKEGRLATLVRRAHDFGLAQVQIRDGAGLLEGGSLLSRPRTDESRGDIITVEQFTDFTLTLDWKMTKGSNSGVIDRATDEHSNVRESGPELQIMENSGVSTG